MTPRPISYFFSKVKRCNHILSKIDQTWMSKLSYSNFLEWYKFFLSQPVDQSCQMVLNSKVQ